MSTAPLALTPEIDDLRRQFEQLSADATALVEPLTDTQFTWQPAPGAWSIAQCIDHLNVTARVYLPKLDEAIASAMRRGLYGRGPFRYSRIGRWMARSQEPPAKLRMKTPKTFYPPPDRSRAEIMAAFRAYQVQYVDRLRQANGLDLARAHVSSPAFNWLRFSLGSGFALTTAHERRHLWQARTIAERADFPR
jgi:hypothetical protein